MCSATSSGDVRQYRNRSPISHPARTLRQLTRRHLAGREAPHPRRHLHYECAPHTPRKTRSLRSPPPRSLSPTPCQHVATSVRRRARHARNVDHCRPQSNTRRKEVWRVYRSVSLPNRSMRDGPDVRSPQFTSTISLLFPLARNYARTTARTKYAQPELASRPCPAQTK